MTTWKVPLADLDFGPEEAAAVLGVIESRWLTMGETTRRFEAAFRKISGTAHAFAVANGTAALHLACLCAGIGPGDEVLVPSLTFVATANAVVYSGGIPVFCDIRGDDDLTLDPEDVARKVGPRTRAMVVMHYGGYLCDMDPILEVARDRNLAVIEDAAHAPGASLNGRAAGSFGDLGCFSFFSNKNMTSGEGGMVTTDRDALAEKLRLMRSHGMTTQTLDRYRGYGKDYDVVELGFNYRITEIQAALGIVQAEKLRGFNKKREKIVSIYHERFAGLPGLTIPFRKPRGVPAYHLYPVLLSSPDLRDRFRDRLQQDGIQTSIHYPPVHRLHWYRNRYSEKINGLPRTEGIADRLATLPLFPAMSDSQVEMVVTAVERFFAKEGKDAGR